MKLRKDERGYIVVETVIGFILFVFFMISILTLVNIVSVQNRVHFALTQTAQELSMYSYILEVTGAADVIKEAGGRADKAKADIDSVKTSLNGVLGGIQSIGGAGSVDDIIGGGEDIYENGENIGDQLQSWLEDPQQTLGNFFAIAVVEAKDAAAQALVEPMFKKYLSTSDKTPDEYLKTWNVIDGMDGMDFTETTFIDSEGNIEIVVSYSIEYSFGALSLPFDELKVTQKAKTRAWLDGNGEGYK